MAHASGLLTNSEFSNTAGTSEHSRVLDLNDLRNSSRWDDDFAEHIQPPKVSSSSSIRERGRAMLNRLIPFEELESYQQELSGMLGDIGLFIPIVVAFAVTKGPDGKPQIDLGATLIFAGLMNMLSGLVFKVPMCVQPMKSIATVALGKFTNAQIMASGILVSAIVGAAGLFNLIELLNFMLVNAVIRGLQIGIGIDLFSKALGYLPANLPPAAPTVTPTWAYSQWISWDGYLLAVLALIFTLFFVRSKRVPTALLLFTFGVLVAIGRMVSAGAPFTVAATQLKVVTITADDWYIAASKGIAGQIPTTIGNSVIAVVKLSEDLYPGRETGLSRRRVAVSVGALNSLFCWFGGYPMCHGSGGLAGQHRFGARTNLSILVLGLIKFLLGVFLGTGLAQLLHYFPQGILAVMLAISALELSAAGWRGMVERDSDNIRLCLITICFTYFWGQQYGIILGLIAACIMKISQACVGSDEDIRSARADLAALRTTVKRLLKESLPGRRRSDPTAGSEPGPHAAPLLPPGPPATTAPRGTGSLTLPRGEESFHAVGCC